MVSQEAVPHLTLKPMNEDIDFYNKASRSEGSSGDNDDEEDDEDIEEDDDEDENSLHVAAGAGKKGSVDPDLAGDSGQFKAAQFDDYEDDEEDESLGEMMMNANLKKSQQDQVWW